MAARKSAEAGVPSSERSALEFEAKLTGVKPVMGKGEGYYATPGRLEVTMAIEQPKPPRDISDVPYQWAGAGGVWKGRPADLTGKAAQDEGKVAARAAEQKRYDEDKASWERRVAEYRRELAAYQPRLIAYAQLVGLAAVFGDQVLTVRMTPKQDVLPGFGVSLLAAPEPLPGDELEAADIIQAIDAADED
jgi:hypothetical protein